jgi:hypothetical protein
MGIRRNSRASRTETVPLVQRNPVGILIPVKRSGFGSLGQQRTNYAPIQACSDVLALTSTGYDDPASSTANVSIFALFIPGHDPGR